MSRGVQEVITSFKLYADLQQGIKEGVTDIKYR